MFALYKKEMTSFLVTPVGYLFVGFFLLIAGILVSSQNLLTGNPAFIDVLSNLTFVFLIVVPILTMRLFAEEKKKKTDILLVTNPLKPLEIVLGKYLAAESIFFITLVITGIYPLMMSFHGSLAGWEILGSYIGFFLLGSCFIAVGVLISSLTESQVSAAVSTFTILLLIWIMGNVSQLPDTMESGIIFALILSLAAGLYLYYFQKAKLLLGVIVMLAGFVLTACIYIINKNIFEGLLLRVFKWFSLLDRFDQFSLGVLDLRPIVFYISFSILFLFFTVRIIERRDN